MMFLNQFSAIIGKTSKKHTQDMTLTNTRYRSKKCLDVEMLPTVIVSIFVSVVAEIGGKFHSVVKVVFVFHAPSNT